MMNTSEEWKSLWPISSVHSPPLLLSPTTINEIGPLIFNPSLQSQTHHHIFSSPSISPQIPPYPTLTRSRFLNKSSSSILPSTATSISPQLSTLLSNPAQFLAHNSLQLLRCPGTDSTLAFFPTGSNSNQVGFVILSVGDSRLTATGDYGENEVFTLENAVTHRIVKISVSPLADCDHNSGDFSDSIIGYLLVSTTNSVHYYKIRIRKEHYGKITPGLELVDNKLFKSSIVVHACWSPHIPEESFVLLENGDLFLFDLDSFSGPTTPSQRLTGKKVKVLWEEYVDFEKGGWLSCDFSWHPRILIVVHSSAVFLVDSRSENYNITPLLKLDTRHSKNDRFLAFSIGGPDRFYFTLATNHMVFLCDIRKPMIPVLRWAHNLANPSYIFVSSLSELRSLSEDATYNRASETGYGILLGSFWNCEFSLFCYGPGPGSVSSSFYAWGLPSDISLVTRECRCGNCLVKEDFSRDQLPVWINWQQKKDFVLGFGILDKEISSQLFKPDKFGGFTVITLTSSGNLELRRYCASWDYSKISEEGHIEQAFDLEDSVIYETGEDGFKYKKVFQYLKLDWLDGYLKSDLDRILSINLYKNRDNEIPGKASFGPEFHETICKIMNEYHSGGPHGAINIKDVFNKDINLPTSIHEIALRSLWANLPKKVLRLGFSTYSDLPNVPAKLKNVPLEFLEVPCQQPDLPPFFFRDPSSRSSKWSEKHKPSSHLVGPVTPIPFLIAYHKTLKLKADNRPADSEIDLECDKVMMVATEVMESESQSCNDHTVSLADDNEDVLHCAQNLQHFSSYKTCAGMKDSVFEDEKHENLIFRVGQKDENDFFDSGCPLKLKFKKQDSSFGTEEEMNYKILKRQFSNFKKGFPIYQKYLTESNIHKK
ncbi:hypothetical protein L1987_30002 [Smallanthus sonchifolius]|uniref:Uncharacterized protein n=1 Tax=Smallanthus sonchifolius TaxID=185202 RepID=A0ACB9I1L5_9ASTR|nr:hypothetical protein L1987_30002 [Smallanthus sonchifolius]